MTMSREAALKYIHDNPNVFLKRARVKGYICPICGSGSGPNGTGITTKDRKRYTCWAGKCFTSADIPDIIAKQYGMKSGSLEALDRSYEIYGIQIEDNQPGRSSFTSDYKITIGKGEQAAPANPSLIGIEKPAAVKREEPEEELDYTAEYEEYHKHIGETDYLQQRGLSEAVANRFNLGYDPAWRSPAAIRKGSNPPPSPRLIIPTGRGSYLARDTRRAIPADQEGYKKQKEGPSGLFNAEALTDASGPVFITEGEIDALSIIEAGGEAVGLGSVSNAGKLLKYLEEHKPAPYLIPALDNDERGIKAQDTIAYLMEQRGIPFLQADNLYGPHKDANAALVADRAGFIEAVQAAIKEAERQREAQPPAAQEQAAQSGNDQAQEMAAQEAAAKAEAERQARTGPGMIDNFLEAVQTRKYEPMPTGITDIDRAIGGGFIRAQLVLLGAAPGAGKTALAQWIFEGMAKRGTSCIFLNLEMAQDQILARSISRITARRGAAIKTTDILQGYKWTEQQKASVLAAAEEYREEIAPRMIYNPQGVTANLDSILGYICQEAERAKAAGEQAPVCVLDYLQLVIGSDREDTTTAIKRAVAGLKAYAIKYNTLVFVIIAHNRESNRTGTVTMEAGRDTSALEYSADLQLALTYTLCMKRDGRKGKAPEDLTEEEKKQVTLKITKGRFSGGARVDLIFNGETMTYTQTVTGYPNKPQIRL